MKILIAEDEEIARVRLEAILKKEGHEVVTVEDGQKAWKTFQTGYFPVVISDWLMPVVNGLVLARQIRKFQRDNYSYVVLITALEGKANYLEAMKAGADDFITKPVDREQLMARLHVAERILGLRRHLNQLEGLLQICSFCKKIRNERQRWEPLEVYVGRHSDARFSHGICKECSEEFLGVSLDDEDTIGETPALGNEPQPPR